jgi:hypothetical protein
MSPDREVLISLHGLLSIGLQGAGRSEIAAVRRQLGPLAEGRMPSAGEAASRPDVSIRFVDHLVTSGTVRQLGLDAAFDDERFFVLRGRRKTSVRVQLPVERLGASHVEIVAERGLSAVPYLLPILNATLLGKGVLPVHASAFVHDGRGVLVTGWAKGGKSEALLAFADRGATYVGDEWVYVSADGSSMGGLPEPMRLWDWQLAMVPGIRERVGLAGRVRLGGAAGLAALLGGASRLPGVRSSAPGDVARRLAAVVERQRSLQIPPARLFGSRMSTGLVPLDSVILIESSSEATASVRSEDPTIVAVRTAATVRHELVDLDTLALHHRFAFPDRQPAFVGELDDRLVRGLTAAFAGKPCLLVRHPYPPDIPALFDLIAPALDGPPAAGDPHGAVKHRKPLPAGEDASGTRI